MSKAEKQVEEDVMLIITMLVHHDYDKSIRQLSLFRYLCIGEKRRRKNGYENETSNRASTRVHIVQRVRVRRC